MSKMQELEAVLNGYAMHPDFRDRILDLVEAIKEDAYADGFDQGEKYGENSL